MENLARDYIYDSQSGIYIAQKQLTYGRAQESAEKLGIDLYPKKYHSFVQIDYSPGTRNFHDIDRLFSAIETKVKGFKSRPINLPEFIRAYTLARDNRAYDQNMMTLWNDLIDSTEFVKNNEKYLIAMAFLQEKNTTQEPNIKFCEPDSEDFKPHSLSRGIREVLAPAN